MALVLTVMGNKFPYWADNLPIFAAMVSYSVANMVSTQGYKYLDSFRRIHKPIILNGEAARLDTIVAR